MHRSGSVFLAAYCLMLVIGLVSCVRGSVLGANYALVCFWGISLLDIASSLRAIARRGDCEDAAPV